ncbi:MAG: NAD(P)/FAD-dependent oxidoreductase, partial [Hyphomicrobiales bacterium]|nr:NAD(P)/FAD-dependent oxidoreductase [Hyphomicrobiales bacterium]
MASIRQNPRVAVIGGGPAGLFAAETLAGAGITVDLFERMPNPGRKLLMAGRGGLNLTHSEPLEPFLGRYGAAPPALAAAIRAFPPAALRDWAEGLGQETFIGSSGRVFPRAMKASSLLRAWLARLADLGIRFHLRHDWLGWAENGALRFATPAGEARAMPDATILALGGASWPR